jgi:hypothetical protein
MSGILAYLKRLVGNGKWASVGIGAFIVILLLAFCHTSRAGEIDFRAGSSFGTEGSAPVIGLQIKAPLNGFNHVNWYAGTLLWGETTYNNRGVPNNWDWHGGLQGCQGRFCASIGAVYMQRIDAINGAHTNFNLELSWLIGYKRISSIDITHISDAGTSTVNIGRQAALIGIRLQ